MRQAILDFVLNDNSDDSTPDFIKDVNVETLPIIMEIGEQNLPIEQLERLEVVLKRILTNAMTGEISGSQARELANATKQLGLLRKYKPYAVKAASPLGYSVFLQRPGEGFSYQNHLEHKTEVFHILEVMEGGFVFLCKYEDWQQNYDRETFEAWLDGQPHPFFDRCRFEPNPGDVFVISELGIVHTVIGCRLEEYATASTDMVQRLHDQNDRNAIPEFDRIETGELLQQLSLPSASRHVDMLSGPDITFADIAPTPQSYGEQVILTDTFVKASYTRMKPYSVVPPETDPERAVLIRVFDGRCNVILNDNEESTSGNDIAPIILGPGELTTVPPGIRFTIINAMETPVSFSEHRIKPEVAFV